MKYFTFLILMFSTASVFGQDLNMEIEYKKSGTDSSYYSFFSVKSWGHTRIEYTEEAKQNFVQGRISVNFDVNDQCQISNISVKKGLGYGLDEIAMDMTKSLQEEFDKIPSDSCFSSNNLTLNIDFTLN
jgi:TonB family protein